MKLKVLKTELKRLNKEEFEAISQKIDKAKADLKVIQEHMNHQWDDKLRDQEKTTLKDLEKWSMVEETILQQKFKAKWIQLSDYNTKNFTVVVKERSHRKQIRELSALDGSRLTKEEDIIEEIIQFYQSLIGATAQVLSAV